MKLSVDRKEFARVAAIAKAFAPTRSPKPILLQFRLAAGSDGATLSATSLDLSIRHKLQYVDVLATGATLLSVPRLASLLKDSKDDTLHIEAAATATTIRGSRNTATIPTEFNPADFPSAVGELPKVKGHVTVDAASLATAIRRTLFACDTESSRYAMGGLLLELEGHTLHVVGSDGRRLAHATVSVAQHGKPTLLIQFPKKSQEKTKPDPQPAIVPIVALKALLKALPKTGTVEISTHADSVYFVMESATIEARGLQGRYPRWREVYPYAWRGQDSQATQLPVAETLATIKAAAVATSYEARGVDFMLSRDLLTLSAKSRDNGQASASLSIHCRRDDVSITLDPRFVSEFLQTMGPRDFVGFSVLDSDSPAMFSTEGADYIVMPLAHDR